MPALSLKNIKQVTFQEGLLLSIMLRVQNVLGLFLLALSFFALAHSLVHTLTPSLTLTQFHDKLELFESSFQ